MKDFYLAIFVFSNNQNLYKCMYVCMYIYCSPTLSSPSCNYRVTSVKSRQLNFAAVKNVKTERSCFNSIKHDLSRSSHNSSVATQARLMSRCGLVYRYMHTNRHTIVYICIYVCKSVLLSTTASHLHST